MHSLRIAWRYLHSDSPNFVAITSQKRSSEVLGLPLDEHAHLRSKCISSMTHTRSA